MFYIETMMNLLSIPSRSRQWEKMKEYRRKNLTEDCIRELKPITLSKAQKSLQCKSWVTEFRNVVGNYSPRDSRNPTDLNSDEIILPFDSIPQFYKYVNYKCSLLLYLISLYIFVIKNLLFLSPFTNSTYTGFLISRLL